MFSTSNFGSTTRLPEDDVRSSEEVSEMVGVTKNKNSEVFPFR